MERLTEKAFVVPEGQWKVLNDEEYKKYKYVVDRPKYADLYSRLGMIENLLCGDKREYSIDRLRELIEADRDGRCVVLPCKPGREVWIVERDEDGEPECITGYVFLAQVKDYVIVAGFLNGSGDVDEILEDQAEQTLIEYNGDLPVFPACDCYLDKEFALKAMKERENDDRA